ncbi:MAG TPA: hypothetical protein VFE31_01545 [Opitutaceae bacterium]|jgi:hypothetical protein|nr:hypothetical protein [Opitutaceae bacterium]
MRAIYRACFELATSAGSDEVFAKFSEITWRWLFDRREVGLSKRPEWATGPTTLAEFAVSGDFRARSLNVESGPQRGWGIVVTQKDLQAPELTWVSDLALLREEDGRHFFSFTQSIGRQDGGVMLERRRPGRPRVIATLVRDFRATSGGVPLSGAPIQLKAVEQDLKKFIAWLESPKRSHPIVLVSVHRQSSRPLINPRELADHLAGIAHVIVAESPGVSSGLSKLLPRWLTCFDGAVRVYWPGFRRSSRTVDHRLWTVDDLAHPSLEFDSGRFADRVLAAIANVSVYSISPRYCSWERLQAIDRARVIAEAKGSEKWEELATAYSTDNEAKEARIAQLERELDEAGQALFKEQQLTAALHAALEERKVGRVALSEEQLPVTSVADAIARAKVGFSQQLVFALNSRSDEKSPFGKPEEVWMAFEWLATNYFSARMKVQGCADLNSDVSQAISGWSYSGHQKEATMKGNEEWYKCSYDGRRIWIPEHLKSGTGRAAVEAIRIAFVWDEHTKKVVVGFIGQHQKNAHTN